MNPQALKEYIADAYGTDAEFPWEKYPNYAVFRHKGNNKWFALIMEVPAERLGLKQGGRLYIVNVKCDPLMADALRAEKGFFPAYHMNKQHWISIALDGTADEEKIKALLDMSYELTAPKIKKQKNSI